MLRRANGSVNHSSQSASQAAESAFAKAEINHNSTQEGDPGGRPLRLAENRPPRPPHRGFVMYPAFALIYGFVAMFVLQSLLRNRREQRAHAPALLFAGRGLMAASVTGAALMLGSAAWANFHV